MTGLSEVEHNTYNQTPLEQDFDGVLFYVALAAARWKLTYKRTAF